MLSAETGSWMFLLLVWSKKPELSISPSVFTTSFCSSFSSLFFLLPLLLPVTYRKQGWHGWFFSICHFHLASPGQRESAEYWSLFRMKEQNNVVLQYLIIAIKLWSQHSSKWGGETKINTSEGKQVVISRSFTMRLSNRLFLKIPAGDKVILQPLEPRRFSVSGSDLERIFTISGVFDLCFGPLSQGPAC